MVTRVKTKRTRRRTTRRRSEVFDRWFVENWI
jgi:hypothetical protein